MIDEPCSGLGCAVRQREEYLRLVGLNGCGKMH